MNDRYLYRGKRTDNGEWVVGYYVNDPQADYPHQIYVISTHPCGHHIVAYSVIPETVGQCTGLKDKNGKLIFEGDCIFTDLARPYNIVEFRNGCFMLNCNDGDEDYYDMMFPLFNQILSNKELTWCEDLEVIGNIHELLEVEE